ncbi:hypothetical protein E4U15_004859 [Claviceps sp. LM218 group G6]|nr:hypothetical protein E4U15_004859 [Claviceps sp. LM218 group G6]
MPKTTANPRVDLNVSERSLWRNSRRDRGDLKASAGYGANRPPHELVAGPRKQHARPIRTTTPPEARQLARHSHRPPGPAGLVGFAGAGRTPHSEPG